jgi:hypothetical protein
MSQRIMDAERFQLLRDIPGITRLNSARVAADSRGGTLRNTKEFGKDTWAITTVAHGVRRRLAGERLRGTRGRR